MVGRAISPKSDFKELKPYTNVNISDIEMRKHFFLSQFTVKAVDWPLRKPIEKSNK